MDSSDCGLELAKKRQNCHPHELEREENVGGALRKSVEVPRKYVEVVRQHVEMPRKYVELARQHSRSAAQSI